MKEINFKGFIALLLIYGVGYLTIMPALAAAITLTLDAEAKALNQTVLAALYLVILAAVGIAAWDIWKDSFRQFVKNWKRSLAETAVFTAAALALNLGASRLILWLSGQETADFAGNQEITVFIVFSAVIFAPVLEETVFRGGIFNFARQRTTFLASALLSAFCFGIIHFPANGASLDPAVAFVYFTVYGGMGFLFAYCCERNKGIFLGICVQALNNLISLFFI